MLKGNTQSVPRKVNGATKYGQQKVYLNHRIPNVLVSIKLFRLICILVWISNKYQEKYEATKTIWPVTSYQMNKNWRYKHQEEVKKTNDTDSSDQKMIIKARKQNITQA